ncbi:hypothetical protein SNEBB_002154 [Seison nebaliae]|nr:hypothetical protein SNEBB_002154 [Seison nebaliae]
MGDIDKLSVMDVSNRLNSLKETQISIETTAKWIQQNEDYADVIVKGWMMSYEDSCWKKRLSLFYLLNHIVQEERCQRKTRCFYELFQPHILEALNEKNLKTLENGKILERLKRVLNIWKERKIYPDNFVKKLMAPVDAIRLMTDDDSKERVEFNKLVENSMKSRELLMDEKNQFEYFQGKFENLKNSSIHPTLPTNSIVVGKESAKKSMKSLKEEHISLKQMKEECGKTKKEVEDYLSTINHVISINSKSFQKTIRDYRQSLMEQEKLMKIVDEIDERIERITSSIHPNLTNTVIERSDMDLASSSSSEDEGKREGELKAHRSKLKKIRYSNE